MKLIIDIPDEVYKNPHNYCCYSLANEFKNGIPLEDIKADIVKIENEIIKITKCKDDMYYGTLNGLERALDIINKHIGVKE